jgi:hypothetical protein
MNYLEWNNAIINHFFNPENEEKEVILYFSEEMIKEIGEENFLLPEDGYVEDFFCALRLGIYGTPNNNYIHRINDLENRYSQGCRGVEKIPFNYPPYLTYLLAFMLPFTSGKLQEGFRMTNFHDIVKLYFENKQLTTNYDRQIKFRLNEIDHLWNKIFDWLFENNNFSLGYIEKIEHPVPNRRYVSKFEYHIVFRKEQEDKLSIIFDNNNILPNEPLGESKIKQLLIDNARELHLTSDTVTKIRNNEYLGEKLVKRAYNYYKNWDGTNRYNYLKNFENTTRVRGFSRKRLVICLKFDILSQKIEIKNFRILSPGGLLEEFTLTDNENNEYKGIEQSLQNPLYSTPITKCFQNFDHNIELKDNSNRIKYTWKSKEFYLFKKDIQLNDWVEISQIEFNAYKTLIISKKRFYSENLKTWLEAESIPTFHKKLYDDNSKNNLPDEWLALTVEQITKYQHPTLPELKTAPETTPKINFEKEYFFNACFYSDILPNVWVENCEVEREQIIAEYFDNKSIPLQKVDDSNLFRFTNEHLLFKNQDFKLKYSNIEYPRFVKILDFDKKKTNEEIKQIQPKRNLIGNTIKSSENPTNYFQGIEHCFENTKIQRMKPTQRNPVTRECIFTNSRNTNSLNQNYNYDKTHKGNILLNYISAKGRISKVDYDISVIRLLQNSDEKENLNKLIRYSLYDLQNLGYTDYDAEQGIIYINKSSTVVKPTESGTTLLLVGARDNKFVRSIIDYSKNGSCYIDIQDSANSLLPQTILIKFKKCNHTIVNDFATHFKLQFKHEEQLFTQFALANAHKITDWQNFVNKTINLNLASDFEGGEIFEIETLQFKEKSNNFDTGLAFIRFQNINGYKTAYRLWYKNEAYHIAEHHYGVYLFLYLYRQLKTEQHKIEKEHGAINTYEYTFKEQSVKLLTNILLYDESKSWLGVPLNCALPKYYSIAFTLLSGKIPEIQQYNNRAYLIYKNVPFLFCNNSLVTTLHQQFDINNKKQQIFQ